MRLARCLIGRHPRFGIVEGDVTKPAGLKFRPINNNPHALHKPPFPHEPSHATVALSTVSILSPVTPSKIVAVAGNYCAPAARRRIKPSTLVPNLFLKPSTCVIGPGAPIFYPAFSSLLLHEAELAVVIKRECRNVTREAVADVVLGYTCANDLTAGDIQRTEPHWTRAKGFDGACPLGPWVETDISLEDAGNLAITCTVNGHVRQAARTSQTIHNITDLIVAITQAMTLLPGDIILTGTPPGYGPISIGDTVTITIERIGALTNTVHAESGR
ncbi:fumarylacetoacetate hydrolase family protein [Streptomyces sp. MS2.AVA.5]|uniref:Fumarylacetoacetate hydrolase family protein n=1 Tax=Streptomyces achmelvichensis TaxID=3134111 RepID=A0ACC6PLW7_9ACTN